MIYKYKGYDVDFNETTGLFVTTVEGVTVKKPSLKAVYGYIDRKEKAGFKPFTVLAKPDYYSNSKPKDGLIELTVIGRKKRESSWRATTYEWVTEATAITHDARRAPAFMVNSEENRKAYVALQRYKEETEAIHSEREKEKDRLLGMIKWHDASTQTIIIGKRGI